MIRKIDAILSLVPDAQVTVRGGQVEWPDEPLLSENEINTEMDRLQAEFEAKDYQRKRVVEYPSIGDQLDALFHAGVFPSDMAEQIQAIKDKYPKV